MTAAFARLEQSWNALLALLARPRTARVLTAALIVVSATALVGLLQRGTVTEGGQGGIDAYAYWSAARHILSQAPLYGGASGDFASYLYPPVFAQIIAPLALLPFAAFLWLWRLLEFVCLRYVMGSWRASGFALFLWLPIFVELDIANVNLLLAAVVAAVIRGDARGLVLSALTKFSSLAALPAALRSDRRGLLIGIGLALLACALSFALAPNAWFDYARFLSHAQEPTLGQDWHNVGALLWTPLRLGLAVVFALAAWRWRRLAAVAVTLAVPVLWFHGLVVLTALYARPGGGSGWGRQTS